MDDATKRKCVSVRQSSAVEVCSSVGSAERMQMPAEEEERTQVAQAGPPRAGRRQQPCKRSSNVNLEAKNKRGSKTKGGQMEEEM